MDKITLNDISEDLYAIETFKADVFSSEDKEKQKIDRFMLALAVFYNDVRDIEIVSQLINQDSTVFEKTNNKYFGQNGGINVFINRLLAGYISEFLKLIRENMDIVESPLFVKIKNSADKKNKACISKIIELSKDEDLRMNKVLRNTRNNASFHYCQSKELYNAYKLATKELNLIPYISLGHAMKHTRFYFSDMALLVYLNKELLSHYESVEDWNDDFNELIGATFGFIMVSLEKYISFQDAIKPAETIEMPNIEYLIKKLLESGARTQNNSIN
jgi:hypothetical protein